ncbi:MAG: S8 family serine peptidase [Thermotogae bacterium]|nr:S8 family serine peptidase [Thermotogota bacterium]
MSVVLIGAALLDPSLERMRLAARPDDSVRVILILEDQMDYTRFLQEHPTRMSRSAHVVKRLFSEAKRLARSTQGPVIDRLRSLGIRDYKSFWITNAISVRTTFALLDELTSIPSVERIIPDRKIHLNMPRIKPTKSDYKLDAVASWGVSKIMADSVWINLGYTGHGVIIGSMDTGVMADHPALIGKVTLWYDPFSGSPTPTDDGGPCVYHGTHTIGTMVGGDGPDAFEEDIGVAPGARVAAVKIFGEDSGYCVATYSSITEGFQKFVEWKVDSGYNIVAVSNSWGSDSTTDLWFWDKVQAWRAADIIPVFANGNEGPGSGTANTPGNYPLVIGVGATDNYDNVADFSSRGPAPNISPWNDPTYWPRSDWNLIKPNISAPGVDITSSVGSSGYTTYSGTSMATPHVTGVIALMFERNPSLDFSTVYNILVDSSDHYGDCASYPNNDCGWGRLNAYRTVLGTPPAPYPHVVKLRTVVDDAAGDGDGRLDPGERANLIVTLRNVGGADALGVVGSLTSLTAEVHVLDGTSSFGTLSPMDTANNAGDPFEVQLDSSALVGRYAIFRLVVNYNSGSYSDTFHLYLMIGNPIDMIVVDTGTALLGVSALTGGLGSHTPDTAGPGFVYPEGGDNFLVYGGVAFGTSPDYLVDSWITMDLAHYWGGVLWDSPRMGDQHGSAGYSDAGHPMAKDIRLDVDVYAHDTYRPNWVFLRYKLINEGSSTVSGLYLGVLADLQIPTWSGDENVGVDSSLNLVYIYDPSYPHRAGLAVVDAPSIVGYGSFNMTNFYGLPNDSSKWIYLNGSRIGESCPVDCGVIASVGPFTLTPGDTVYATFAFVGFDDVATAVREMPYVAKPRIDVDVKNRKAVIHILYIEGMPLEVKLYSVSGRLIEILYRGKFVEDLHIETGTIPIGTYILSVKTEGGTFLRRFIVR